MKHPVSPCSNCPYRRDVKTRHWAREEFEDLVKNEGTQFGTVYACHKQSGLEPPDRGMCAGWLLDQKKRNIPSIMLRMKLIGDLEAVAALKSVSSGGHPLYRTFESMCRANGVNPKRKGLK